jgi:hypothetical protein
MRKYYSVSSLSPDIHVLQSGGGIVDGWHVCQYCTRFPGIIKGSAVSSQTWSRLAGAVPHHNQQNGACQKYRNALASVHDLPLLKRTCFLEFGVYRGRKEIVKQKNRAERGLLKEMVLSGFIFTSARR